MDKQLKLEARVILLEQFNDGISNVNKALKRVAEEIGPRTISEAEAVLWYRRFKNNDTEMNHDVSKRYQKLMSNGTLAKSMRALIDESLFHNCEFATVEQIYGTDHRFQVVCKHKAEEETYWLLDTFYNVQKRLSIDISTIEGLEADGVLSWGPFYFDSKVGFYGRVTRIIRSHRTFLYCGEFDFVNCCLKINTVTEIPGSYHATIFYDTKTPFRVMTCNTDGITNSSILDYEWDNGRFVLQNTLNLEHNIFFESVQNNKLFGWFMIDWRVFHSPMDGTKFVEVSLADGSKTEHKIEEENRLTEEVDVMTLHVWSGDKFLLELYNRDDDVSTIAQFDASKKEWKKTKMETQGYITDMTATNGVLIVNSSPNSKLIQTYRFNYTQTDSLANLTWRAMRRYSRSNSQFQKWFVSKLPKRSRFRPLW
ncbi:hypothetical protein M3Y95_00955700 [Aphelenchoides besseyi]|nr:hypothetical protein M3Y95_00955700 [Aphelenchoides besseyi]